MNSIIVSCNLITVVSAILFGGEREEQSNRENKRFKSQYLNDFGIQTSINIFNSRSTL